MNGRVLMQFLSRVLWFSTILSFKTYWSAIGPLTWLIIKLPRFVLQGFFFVLLVSYAAGPSLSTFAAVGNAFSAALMASAVNFAQVVQREKVLGTWPALLATSGPIWLALVGLSAAGLAEALAGAVVAFIVLNIAAGGYFSLVSVLLSLPLFLLILLSAGSLGWLVGAVTLPVRYGLLATNLIGYAMLLLCGLNFPIDLLPEPLPSVVHFLPVTNGLLALRALLAGRPYTEVLGYSLGELAVLVAFTLAARWVFQLRLSKARQAGKLEAY